MAEAVREAFAESAGVASVDGVDEDGDRSDKAHPAGEPCGVGQVGVDDFGMVVGGPAEVAEPASGVDPGFAHF